MPNEPTPAQPEQEMRDRAFQWLAAGDRRLLTQVDKLDAFAQQEVERRTREIIALFEEGTYQDAWPARVLRAKYKLTEQGERG